MHTQSLHRLLGGISRRLASRMPHKSSILGYLNPDFGFYCSLASCFATRRRARDICSARIWESPLTHIHNPQSPTHYQGPSTNFHSRIRQRATHIRRGCGPIVTASPKLCPRILHIINHSDITSYCRKCEVVVRDLIWAKFLDALIIHPIYYFGALHNYGS